MRKKVQQAMAAGGSFAVATALMLSLGIAAPVQAATATGNAEGQLAETASIKCDSPSGNTANYSWSNEGSQTVTVYFNNHCSHKVEAKLHFSKVPDTKCLVTNGATKGKKKFNLPSMDMTKITKGC